MKRLRICLLLSITLSCGERDGILKDPSENRQIREQKFFLIDKKLVDRNCREPLPGKRIDNIGPFLDGFAFVNVNGKYGYIDEEGNLIAEIKYDHAADFLNGQAPVVWKGQDLFLDKIGKVVGKRPPFESLGPTAEGWTSFTYRDHWGFFDSANRVVIPIQFDTPPHTDSYRYKFNEGFAPVYLNYKYGMIDKKGKYLLEPIYEEVTDFNDGLAGFKTEKGWGFIDANGKVVIPNRFHNLHRGNLNDRPKPFQNGRIFVWDSVNGKNEGYFIDKTGKRLDLPQYLREPFSDGLSILNKDNKYKEYGFINEKGDIVVPPIYEKVYPFRNGLAAVVKSKKVGFVSTTGELAIPMDFDYSEPYLDSNPSPLNSFENERAVVRKKDKFGVIDPKGNFVIPAEFNRIYFRKDGSIFTWKGEHRNLYDRNGFLPDCK
ncbi:hypothetical protein CH371_18010 [Leptospira wolffii]|uniref:WG repeat-containing protein n=1 Tax=Leptospira wolffii TaxID=409998 RepID=A0A2M9Z7D7_9LEPT|nr:WG repeat-containing protein [Leptospira wolffii]PJZ64318.1 hypothetical protein CH371_18010 [Leptospira wolffii]